MKQDKQQKEQKDVESKSWNSVSQNINDEQEVHLKISLEKSPKNKAKEEEKQKPVVQLNLMAPEVECDNQGIQPIKHFLHISYSKIRNS